MFSIKSKLKPNKSRGSKLVRAYLFKLCPELFSDATLTLWRAVGRTAHVPCLLRSGLLATKKGIHRSRQKNLPVCLISEFRRLIGTAFTPELTQYYSQSLPTQWRFQKGTSTECVISFSWNKLRRAMPMAAVLYMQKTYHSVRRHMLQYMLDGQLPTTLSISLHPLLWPMLLRTRNQKSGTGFRTLVGISQGDPPSPYLFNIFMDGYIREMNLEVSKGLATLFLDDVLLLCLICRDSCSSQNHGLTKST